MSYKQVHGKFYGQRDLVDPIIGAVTATICLGVFSLMLSSVGEKKGGLSGGDWAWVVICLAVLWAMIFSVVWYVSWRFRHPDQAETFDANRKSSGKAWTDARNTQRLEKRYTARPSSAASQEVIEYSSAKDFEADRSKWLGTGWKITSISDSPQRPGIARVATLGLGALVIKPGSHVFVIYERELPALQPTSTSDVPPSYRADRSAAPKHEFTVESVGENLWTVVGRLDVSHQALGAFMIKQGIIMDGADKSWQFREDKTGCFVALPYSGDLEEMDGRVMDALIIRAQGCLEAKIKYIQQKGKEYKERFPVDFKRDV